MSLLPRIFRRHLHLPLGCQLRSPECSTRLRQSLYNLAGLFRTPQASLPDSPPLICVLTTRPTPHSERLICAAPAHPRTISLYGSYVHNNVAELVYPAMNIPLGCVYLTLDYVVGLAGVWPWGCGGLRMVRVLPGPSSIVPAMNIPLGCVYLTLDYVVGLAGVWLFGCSNSVYKP